MFANDTKAYFFLECDEKGEYIGLEEVWELEEPSSERMDGVQQLALQGDREERYFATLTLLEWMEPIGLDACEKLLESKTLNEGPPLAPHRLWVKDCLYEELASRVISRFGPWKKHVALVKRFLSPDIYGNYHFLNGFFTKRLTPNKLNPTSQRFNVFADEIKVALNSALHSKTLTYPEFQASLCLQPLVKMGKSGEETLKYFFKLPGGAPDPRYEAVLAARHLPDRGEKLLQEWAQSSDPEAQRWIRNMDHLP